MKDPKRASMLKLSATKEVPRTSHNLFLSVQKGKFHPNTKNGCYIVSLILIKLSIMWIEKAYWECLRRWDSYGGGSVGTISQGLRLGIVVKG